MINDPKSLPCLHTYCFKCLSEWAKPTSTSVTCPMCRKECTLPSDGVAGLESNFFVTKLKDRKTVNLKLASKDCKIPCTNCEGSDQAAVARCFQCDDFLCANCLKSHKTLRLTRGHHTFTLDELRSGKVDPIAKAEYCSKHKGQELWIYCETCNLLICRDCTVFDHCKPEHKFVDLQTAAKGQKENIEKLAEECKSLTLQVDAAIENDKQVVQKLVASASNAMDDLTKSYEQVKSSLLAQLETNYATLSAEIKNEEAKGCKDIESHTEELRILRTRLRTSLETASQLIKTGSDCDIAQMYGSVTTSLEELRDVKEPPLQEKRIERVVFKANAEASKHLAPIGSVSPAVKELYIKKNKWEYQRQINTPISKCISDIALVKDNIDEICVVEQFKQAYVISNNTHRNVTKLTSPFGITCSKNGKYFTTADDPFVYKFSSNLSEEGKFSIQLPLAESNEALGITISKKSNTIVVGDHANMLISTYAQGGTQIKYFKVPVHPWYISSNSQDHVAMSCGLTQCCKSVVVVDMEQSGRVLFTVTAPPGVPEWNPKGVCWSKTDELFVVNSAGEKGVHQFSASGEYKGCVITGLNSPTCLIISRDDKMLVGDLACVKVYHLT